MTDNKNGRMANLHIGLIPDGNRRYAIQAGLPIQKGHWQGAHKLEEFLGWCLEYPAIKTVSVFALSTENLTRTKSEINELWKIYNAYFRKIINSKKIKEKKVKVNFYGNDKLWHPGIRQTIREVINATKSYGSICFNIMLAYGSREEIDSAMRKLVESPILTESINRMLYVRDPIDLCIRTGGQHRLSNFMLYQSAYSELFFSDTLFPEFEKKEFDRIMKWYYRQIRKFGK